MELCREENVESTHVADVTATGRMRMFSGSEMIVDLAREFIDSAGAKHYTEIEIAAVEDRDPFRRDIAGDSLAERVEADLSSDNVLFTEGIDRDVRLHDRSLDRADALRRPHADHRDSGVGAETPVGDAYTDTASIMAFGYNPDLMSWSPYHGAAYSVVEACAKVVAAGARYDRMRFSYQEYFERMSSPASWGKPMAALLGTLKMQVALGLPSIGGKDSMSGTFRDINVPPTPRGLRHHDRRRTHGHKPRAQACGRQTLPYTPPSARRPHARHRRPEPQLYVRLGQDRTGYDHGGMGYRLRRRSRSAGQDVVRQPHRSRSRMRRTYSVRPLLRLDSGREQPHAQLRVGRAARYDGSRPSAYDQRRAHVDRLSAGGQHRAIQHRISRPRTPRRSYPAGRLPSQGRRISRRAGRQGKGLHSGIPRHQLRLRHGARIPPRRRRGRRGGIPQPYFRTTYSRRSTR